MRLFVLFCNRRIFTSFLLISYIFVIKVKHFHFIMNIFMDNKKSITSRKYENFEAESDFLESIIDTVRESLVILDENFRITSANKTFYMVFKFKPAEVIGQKIYALENRQWDRESLKKLLEEILPHHNPFNGYRFEYHTLQGKKTLLLNARQIKQKGKWQNRILLAIEDVTQYEIQRQAHEKLAQRELTFLREIESNQKKFRTLIQQSADAIVLISPEGDILFSSFSLKKVLGYTNAEITNTNIFSHIHPEDIPPFDRKLNTFLKHAGTQITVEVRIKHKNGNWIWIEATAVNHLDNPSINAVVANFRNISQRKQIEGKLKEQAALITVANDAFIVLDKENKIMSWNAGAERIYGYTEKEVLGKVAPKVLKTKFPIPFEEIRKKIYSVGTWRGEIEHTKKNGQVIMVDSNWVLFDKNKILEVNRDITDRKMLERQKDDFVGIATHELKTPVTSIKAYTQVLQQIFLRKNDIQAANYLGKMDAQLNKLTNLIGDLLDITKIESGRLQFHEEWFDINELAEEIIEQLQLTTERHTLIKHFGHTQKLYGDRDRIGQVIINLISNAIKYSPYANKIIITTGTDKNHITFCVQDFGVGIPKDKQAKVFEKFFRVSGPEKQTFPGMGLGLYISNEIIKRLGGKIWVESAERKGSLFCFKLPIQADITQQKNTLAEIQLQHE